MHIEKGADACARIRETDKEREKEKNGGREKEAEEEKEQMGKRAIFLNVGDSFNDS